MEETRDNCGYSLPARDAAPKVEKSPPKSPAAVREKRHVSGPMKFVIGEKTRATALEGVDAWRKKFATEPKWKGVLARLKTFAAEDNLRLSGEPGEGRKKEKEKDSAARRSTARSAPWPGQTRPPTLTSPLASLHSPSTPRARWDIPAQGPLTPLTPTPTGNAFGPGGFWEKLSPQTITPVPATPITAILLVPRSPVVPKDPEARAAYEEIKREVDNMALKLCASRLSIYSTSSSSTSTGTSSTSVIASLVHPSMVKPQDELAAAEFILQSRLKSADAQLKHTIDPQLPQKMAACAKDSAAAIDTYSIRDTAALQNSHTWLQLDTQTGSLTTILDAQRAILAMQRDRRKSKDLALSQAAVRLAWATRVLEDAERKVAAWDGGSVGSQESGYDYGNFLRSLRGEGVEERGSVGDLGGLRSRSATMTTGTDVSAASLSARSSASLKGVGGFRFVPGSGSSVFGMQEGDGAVSRTGTPTSIPTPTLIPTPAHIPTAISIPRHRHHHHRHNQPSKTLSISTPSPALNPSSPPPLSPEDKEFRHQGPSHADLKSWAAELKKLRSSISSSRSAGSGVDVDVDVDVGGAVHPALRSSTDSGSREEGRSRGRRETRDRDRESQGSEGSWRCVSAAGVERCGQRHSVSLEPQARCTSRAGSSSHDAVRARSRAESQAGSTKEEEEDEWVAELKRMESREVMRQKWG